MVGGKKNFILYYTFFVLRGSLVDILFVQLDVVERKKEKKLTHISKLKNDWEKNTSSY